MEMMFTMFRACELCDGQWIVNWNHLMKDRFSTKTFPQINRRFKDIHNKNFWWEWGSCQILSGPKSTTFENSSRSW